MTCADADTGLQDKNGHPLKPAGTNSVRFEGYLEVPAPGAYRFNVALDKKNAEAELRFDHLPFQPVPEMEIETTEFDDVLANSDFLSFHVPHGEGMPPMIDEECFMRMKKGVGIVKCARGGVIDETALLKALDSGQVAFAALDVFEGEPKPRPDVLQHPKVSLTPHIGASTREAQDRVGQEVAQVVIDYFKKNGN